MKKIVALLIFTLLLGCIAGAETIDVTYNDIKVYVNGVQVDLYDDYGNEVEPFICNGTIYLPLPAVTDVLDMNALYAWENEGMSVYLGVIPGERRYLTDEVQPYQNGGITVCSTANGRSFTMAGNKYTNGISFNYSGNGHTYALYNLNGKYESMQFTLGHVDGQDMWNITVQIYLDGKLAGEYVAKAEGLPVTYTLELNHALSMKIITLGNGYCCAMGEIIVE